MSWNSNTVLSWSDSRVHNLYRLSKISSDGISDMDNRTSSHLVSNSWMLSSRRVTEHNLKLCHESQSLENGRRSWRRCVFLEETGPLFGLSAPRSWPSSWTGNSGWSCSEQRQSSRPASRNLENFPQTDREDFNSSTESTISTTQGSIRWKIRTSSHLIFESNFPH